MVLGPMFLVGEILKIKIISFLAIFLNIIGDFFDGFLARKRKETTRVGEILDPAVDLLFFAFVSLGFNKKYPPINLFLFPIFLILLSFVLPILIKKRICVFHTKTKFFHTPLIYFVSIILIFNFLGNFFASIFLLALLIFSFGALESFFQSLKFIFKNNARPSA
jgi:phosphatidylglycerophosphate synthase